MITIKRRAGFIERVPSLDELDQKELPIIVRNQVQELQNELDNIWRHLGEKARADEPWESNEALRKLEALKEQIKVLSK